MEHFLLFHEAPLWTPQDASGRLLITICTRYKVQGASHFPDASIALVIKSTFRRTKKKKKKKKEKTSEERIKDAARGSTQEREVEEGRGRCRVYDEDIKRGGDRKRGRRTKIGEEKVRKSET